MLPSVLLEENHRQGNDHHYAELLRRLRTKDYTEDDLRILRSRIRDAKHKDIENAGLYISSKVKPCYDINSKYIAKLKGTAMKLKAVHHHDNIKSYKPFIKKRDGTIGETGFQDILILKPGARVIIIHNIDTLDSLIVSFEAKPNSLVKVIESHIDIDYCVHKCCFC